MECTDAQLVRAAREGDREAFGELVDRHRESVVRLCLRVTRNLPDAEDLAHDAFVDAFLRLSRLRSDESFPAWLRTIALNVCRMWYRSRARRRVAPLEEALVCAAPTARAATPRLGAALGRLTPDRRMALVLHYWEGLSYEEIARFLGIPAGTVMSRLHRAKRDLKQIVEQCGHEEAVMENREFRREVDAEIAALARIYGEDREARQRLSIVLRHNPERLAALIADPEQTPDDLGRLLRRLGPVSIQAAVACALAEAPALRERAEAALRSAVAVPARHEAGDLRTRIAPRAAYQLADALRESAVPERARARLVVALLREDLGEQSALILLNVLLSWPDATLAALMEWFWSCPTARDLHRHGDLLQACARFGTRFVGELLPVLEGVQAGSRETALAGVQAAVRSLRCRWLDRGSAPEEVLAAERRFRRKWAPALAMENEAAVQADLAQSLSRLAASPDGRTAETAVTTLGLLGDADMTGEVRLLASEARGGVRVAAIRALADLGDEAAWPALEPALRSGTGAERKAAIDAVGRLRLMAAAPALAELLAEGEPAVQVLAAAALGELGTDAAREALRAATRSANAAVARAATNALYGSLRRPQTGKAPRHTLMEGIIREGAEPATYISLESAIAALPEDAPYDERAITARIAAVCVDYSSARRFLIEEGLMTRDHGIYELTEFGRAVWRVERWLMRPAVAVTPD